MAWCWFSTNKQNIDAHMIAGRRSQAPPPYMVWSGNHVWGGHADLRLDHDPQIAHKTTHTNPQGGKEQAQVVGHKLPHPRPPIWYGSATIGGRPTSYHIYLTFMACPYTWLRDSGQLPRKRTFCVRFLEHLRPNVLRIKIF